MRRWFLLIGALTCASCTGCSGGSSGGSSNGSSVGSSKGSSGGPSPVATRTAAAGVEGNATVVHIDDGDTIDVDVGGTRTRVRLIGIDTPETKKPNTPVQCFGPEATAATTAWLPLGTAVRLERDVEARDPYDRLLAYVYRADDGLFVNLELATQGLARALSIAPNTAHAGEFADAVADATRARRGLWGSCPSFGAPAAISDAVPTSSPTGG